MQCTATTGEEARAEVEALQELGVTRVLIPAVLFGVRSSETSLAGATAEDVIEPSLAVTEPAQVGERDRIEPFRIRVDDAGPRLDLHHRLARTRFPDQIEGTGWEYGIPIDYLRQLVEYWRDTYDWRAEEARLNGFDHFRTTIDGQSIHFIHARSAHPDALPLLLTHGWPGSIVEFLDVIPRLTDPEAYGGRAE